MNNSINFLYFNDANGYFTNLLLAEQVRQLTQDFHGYTSEAPEGGTGIDSRYVTPFTNAKAKNIDINLADFAIDEYTLKGLLEETFFRIYGYTPKQQQEFERLWQLTKVNPNLEPLFGGYSNGVCQIEPQLDINYETKQLRVVGENLKAININRIDLSLMVPSILHEWTHAQLTNKTPYESIFMGEFFSILIERVSAIMAATQTNKSDLRKVVEIARTNSTIDTVKQLHTMDKVFNQLSTIEKRATIMKQMELVPTNDLIVLRSQMLQSLTFLHSDIYAYAMGEKYLQDPAKFYDQMKKVMNGRRTAKDMLEYYGISIRKKETLDSIEKRMEEYR